MKVIKTLAPIEINLGVLVSALGITLPDDSPYKTQDTLQIETSGMRATVKRAATDEFMSTAITVAELELVPVVIGAYLRRKENKFCVFVDDSEGNNSQLIHTYENGEIDYIAPGKLIGLSVEESKRTVCRQGIEPRLAVVSSTKNPRDQVIREIEFNKDSTGRMHVTCSTTNQKSQLFAYDPTELEFMANELVGLTIDEALDLHNKKDTEFLENK